MHLSFIIAAVLAWTVAALVPARRDALVPVERDAQDRSCWGKYDIHTNYYEEYPDTGVVREYWFNIVNTTAAPDGVERMVLSINGSVPGPTIVADWGDTIVVHVTNSMQDNGTSIHFHGIRQLGTLMMDGVSSVTQCPIAPGSSFTYRWKATQYGSSWYHSHFYVQAWDGVFGGIVINGPASANYDEDLGVMFLNDWSHETADVLAIRALSRIYPSDNGLLNGTHVYHDNAKDVTMGSYFETVFAPGKRYRLRLVNAAAYASFRFSLDHHRMQVIATDFVPIVPYEAESLMIAMGQRYDVIITADAPPDDYWMHAIPQSECSFVNVTDVRGIVRYTRDDMPAPGCEPTSTAWDTAWYDSCADEDMDKLVPVVPIVAADVASSLNDEEFAVAIYNTSKGLRWEMGSKSFVSEWEYPTVIQVLDGVSNWTTEQQVYSYPGANQWVYFIIQTTMPQAHPMHLHGHDFWILGQGEGEYDPATANLKLANAPRRDTLQLDGSSYVVIAFYTDNPGIWIMHCHIAWHLSEGLAIQIIEREDEFLSQLDYDTLNNTCADWKNYVSKEHVVQEDAGI